jgi:5'-nucleotidase
MNLLLTNDDGIDADGLWALYDAFAPGHEVSVVAPDRERSAVGHGITLHQPLRSRQVRRNGCPHAIAVSGLPADCVKLALSNLMPTPPDMVIAGINPGANLGINIHYSGTVAAAKEAALAGIPALAVSLAVDAEPCSSAAMERAAAIARNLAERVRQEGLPYGTFLNVNVPGNALAPAGIRICRHGLQPPRETYERREDPHRRPYYWPGVDRQTFAADPALDGSALEEGFVSVTPITCDGTDYSLMARLETWNHR